MHLEIPEDYHPSLDLGGLDPKVASAYKDGNGVVAARNIVGVESNDGRIAFLGIVGTSRGLAEAVSEIHQVFADEFRWRWSVVRALGRR